MIYFICLPVLILLLPANFKLWLAYIAAYVIISILLSINNKSEDKLISKKNSRLSISVIILDLIVTFIFIMRWIPSGIIKSVCSKISLDSSICLVIIGIILGVLSYRGIRIILKFVVDVFINTGMYYSILRDKLNINSVSSRIIFALIFTTVFWLSQYRMPLYIDIDNYQMSQVLCGMFASDNYCDFLSPILAYIVKGINFVFHNADGYMLFREMLVLFAVATMFYVLFTTLKSKGNVFICLLVLILVNYLLNISHSNFTIFSAFLTCVGVFTIYSCVRKKTSIITGIIGLILVFDACLFRLNSCMMSIPFLILIATAEFVTNRKNKNVLKRTIAFSFAVLLIIVGSAGIDKIYKSSDVYSDSVSFNSLRSAIFDYETKTWSEVEEELKNKNITENDLNLLKESFLADTEVIDSNYLKTVNDIVKLNNGYSLDMFFSRSSSIWYFILYENVITLQVILLICALFLLLLFSNCSVIRILELALALIGTLLIFIGLAFVVGRMPSYVMTSILLYDWLVFSTILVGEKAEFSINGRGIKKITVGFMLAVCVLGYTQTAKSEISALLPSLNAKSNQNYSHSENQGTYIWSPSCYNQFVEDEFCRFDKLPSEEFMKYNIVDGKWVYGHIYYEEYLDKIGLSNPVKSLYNDNTYYVSDEERCNKVLIYLKEHYSSDTKVDIVDTINGMPVWKFSEE